MASTTLSSVDFECEFVDQVPEDYVCGICQLVMRQPVQTNCGHRFCKECLEVAFASAQQCPVDRENLSTDQVFSDLATERQILSLRVACTHQWCEWQGELRNAQGQKRHLVDHYDRNIEEHLGMQLNQILNLQEENKRLNHALKIDRDQIRCNFTDKMIALEHENNDLKRELLLATSSSTALVSGLQEQLKTIRRENDEFRKQLEITMTTYGSAWSKEDSSRRSFREKLKLKFKRHGQEGTFDENPKSNNIDHFPDDLRTLQHEHKKLQNQLHDISSSSAFTQLMNKQENHQLHFTWRIRDFSEKLKQAQSQQDAAEIYSHPFYTNRPGYKLRLVMHPGGEGEGKGTHASIYMIIMKGEYDAILTWPFHWKYRFTLIDQKPGKEARKNIVQRSFAPSKSLVDFMRPTARENRGIGYPLFVPHMLLQTENFVVDGDIFVDFEIFK